MPVTEVRQVVGTVLAQVRQLGMTALQVSHNRVIEFKYEPEGHRH